MPYPFSTRHARRAALALVASLSTACGGDPKPPPTPDPPQVQVTVPEGTLASTSLKINVTVSGCDSVSNLSINDRDTPIKSFPYNGGTATLELMPADIPYRTAGLAASLSLRAEATCADGRKNTSQPQPATFLPAARRVVNTQNSQQVVPDFFVANGSGTNMAFIGCGNPSTGIATLYRVDSEGRVTGERQMPFACTADTVITERNPTSGKRWVWTPGAGALSLDDNLNIISRTAPEFQATLLSVMPDGDALIVNRIYQVRRLAHSNEPGSATPEKWMYEEFEPLLTAPVVVGGTVRIVSTGRANDPLQTVVLVTDLDGQTGTVRNQYRLRTLFRQDPKPLAAFSTDGTTLYLGFQLASEQSQVQACNPAGGECEGSNQRWVSPVLPVPLAQLAFHEVTSRVVAAGRQRVWLLDSGTGAIRNRENRSLDANGALNVLHILPARPPATELFLLTGPARASGGPATYPQEIVAIEQPAGGEARELFRYQEPVSLSAAVADDGRLWMRTGRNLVQALPMGDYRRFRQ